MTHYDYFLDDYSLREAVEQLNGRRLCYVCHDRREVTEACNYCFDCDTYFCTDCTEAHRHMPNQKKHRVKSLEMVTPGDLMKLKRRFCKTHEGVPLDLFCMVSLLYESMELICKFFILFLCIIIIITFT